MKLPVINTNSYNKLIYFFDFHNCLQCFQIKFVISPQFASYFCNSSWNSYLPMILFYEAEAQYFYTVISIQSYTDIYF